VYHVDPRTGLYTLPERVTITRRLVDPGLSSTARARLATRGVAARREREANKSQQHSEIRALIRALNDTEREGKARLLAVAREVAKQSRAAWQRYMVQAERVTGVGRDVLEDLSPPSWKDEVVDTIASFDPTYDAEELFGMSLSDDDD